MIITLSQLTILLAYKLCVCVLISKRGRCLHACDLRHMRARSDSRRHKYANTKIHSFRRTRAFVCRVCVSVCVCIVFAVERESVFARAFVRIRNAVVVVSICRVRFVFAPQPAIGN